jgi:hypothetical protein
MQSRPRAYVQFSGINRYGLRGEGLASETEPAADDFLAQLTVRWEAASEGIEKLGVRRVIVRNAIVLDARRGLFPLMSLPARLWAGGRLGRGEQIVPWIHLTDHVRAIRLLLEDEGAAGAYNLVAPEPTSNAEFMEAACRALGRPYWLHVPAPVLKLSLGEMSMIVLEGRASEPRRLRELGFRFRFPRIAEAMADLLATPAA